MLVTCPECLKKISDTVNACPHCGYKITSEMIVNLKKAKSHSQIIWGSVLGFVVLYFVFFYLFSRANYEEISYKNDLYTKSGYIACLTEDHLDKMIQFAADKDPDAFNRMIASRQCFLLKPGIPVYIMDTKALSGTVKIRAKGYTEGLWVLRSALQDTKPPETALPQPEPTPTELDIVVKGDLFIKVIKDNVQVYELADPNSKVISTIPKNTFLTSTAHSKYWCQVQTPAGPAWIGKSNIEVLK